jgi:hypothetical protein
MFQVYFGYLPIPSPRKVCNMNPLSPRARASVLANGKAGAIASTVITSTVANILPEPGSRQMIIALAGVPSSRIYRTHC